MAHLELPINEWVKICRASHDRKLVGEEACGLLLATRTGGLSFVTSRNLSDRPADSFVIDPRLQETAVGEGWTVVGMVHSHPNGKPEPSDLDRDTYVPRGWWYLVVGFKTGAPIVGCWQSEDETLVRRNMIVV